MGSGVSVPADSRQVADLLEHLPADELTAAGLTPTKSTTSTALDEDGVPHQIKEKVARMVASAMANSPDEGRLEMNSQMLERLSELPRLLHALESSDADERRDATEQVRRFLSIERNPPIQAVVDAGCVPTLINFLAFDEDPHLQLEAGWALTNIASGTSDQTDAVARAGAIPAFVRLLATSSSVQVREQAVWALGNIAGDSAAYRNEVLAAGALKPLLSELLSHMPPPGGSTTPPRRRSLAVAGANHKNTVVVEPAMIEVDSGRGHEHQLQQQQQQHLGEPTASQRASLLRNGAWLLSNLCRGKPRVALYKLKPALPVLARLLTCCQDDEDTLADALWAVSYLSDGEQANIDAVLSTHAVGLDRSYHQDDDDGDDDVDGADEEMAKAKAEGSHGTGVGRGSGRGGSSAGGLARRLVSLLTHRAVAVQTPALRCVGNLVTGDDASTDALVRLPNALQALKELITATPMSQRGHVYSRSSTSKAAFAALKKEACWALSNVTAGTESQIQAVLDCELMPPLLALAALDNHLPGPGGNGLKSRHRVVPYGAIDDNDDQQQAKEEGDVGVGEGHPHALTSSQAAAVDAAALELGLGGGASSSSSSSSSSPYGKGKENQGVGNSLNGYVASSKEFGAAAVDVQKEAVWAVSNAASGASKRQIRALVRLGAVRALCASLRGGKGDPKTCAVAADGLAQLLRKAGGGDSAARGAVARGSPAYRWRRKVVKAVRTSGGDHALKKLAASAGPGAGIGTRHSHTKGGSSSSSSKGGLSSAAQEAGAKATALLGLIALTKEVLARARRDARRGGSDGHMSGKLGRGYGAEDDEEEEGEDEVDDPNDDEDDEDDRDDEQDDRDLAAAKAAGFGIYSIHTRGGGLSKYSTNGSSSSNNHSEDLRSGGDRGLEGGDLLEDNSNDADEWGNDDDDEEVQSSHAVKVVCGRGMSAPSPTSGGGGGGAHRVVSVAPASDRKSHGASPHSPERTPGKVEVRRLGPGNVNRCLDDDEYKDNGSFDDGDRGAIGGFLGELGEEAKLAAAMAALERDLGLVQLSSSSSGGGSGIRSSEASTNEMGKPKRGWTAAWDV